MFLTRVNAVFAVVLILVVFSLGTFDRPLIASAARPQPTPANDNKNMVDFRGVAIGMTTDAVRGKLGNPKDKSDEMDLYVFSDKESAQFYYNAAKNVTAIMANFSGDLKDAPTPKAVLGEDAETKPDGSIFKMVRFPKAGYWISYNRTSPPDAIVNIAFQKM